MEPPAEVVHWMFGVGFVFLGLCLLAETIVGRDVWRRRSWRAYLWPSVAFLLFCDRNVAPIFGHLSPLAGLR